jgi:hypothetical protein
MEGGWWLWRPGVRRGNKRVGKALYGVDILYYSHTTSCPCWGVNGGRGRDMVMCKEAHDQARANLA